jgi:hypothetical protein
MARRNEGLDPELLKWLEELQTSVAKLSGKETALAELTTAREAVEKLRKEVTNLKIEKSHLDESNARERRETEHMVGLERKRQEFEIDQSKREAVVAVREENLEADRKRFEEQMKFIMTRFETEVASQKELMGDILKRLPTVTWRAMDTRTRRRSMPSASSSSMSYSNVTSSAIADILPQNYQNLGYTVSIGTIPGSTFRSLPTQGFASPATPKLKKLTAMEWLQDRVDEIAGVGRMALAEPW